MSSNGFPPSCLKLTVVSPLLSPSTLSILPPRGMSSLPQHGSPHSHPLLLTIPCFPSSFELHAIPDSSCPEASSVLQTPLALQTNSCLAALVTNRSHGHGDRLGSRLSILERR